MFITSYTNSIYFKPSNFHFLDREPRLEDYHYITHDGYYEVRRSRSLNFYRILRRKLSPSEMETLAPGQEKKNEEK